MIKISDFFQSEILLEAKRDSGRELFLYADNSFEFNSISLRGTNIRKGTYQISNDDVILTYDSVEYYEYKTITMKIKNNSIGEMRIIKYNLKNLPATNRR